MKLLDHFIQIDGWSTSRKTLLLACIALAFHFPGTLMVDWAIVHAGELAARIDAPLLRRFLWGWTGVVACILLISLLVVRRGHEGRWTCLLIIPYGVCLALMMWLFGFMSSALSAAYPMTIGALTVLYGPRFGAIAFVCGLCMAVTLLWLQTAGHIPFTPLFVDRQLDTQNFAIYAVPVFVIFMGFFVALFGLMILLLMARRKQAALLEAANRERDLALQRLNRSAALISRYLPSQLAERILQGEHPQDFQPERRRLTVFFSDLVGFTSITEALEPEDLARILNEYFSEMTQIAHRHQGTVDELSGDGILVFFGAPTATSDAEHAWNAVRMAQDMQAAIARLNARWSAEGITHTLTARMGINTGIVTMGNFGSPERMKYAVLGKHVNLAARLQAICEPGGILISHSTWLLVGQRVACEPNGEVGLKGILRPVMTYRVIAPA